MTFGEHVMYVKVVKCVVGGGLKMQWPKQQMDEKAAQSFGRPVAVYSHCGW